MGLSHSEQRRRGVALSLENAGIGRAYHSRSLGEATGGAISGLPTWIKSGEAATEVRAGKGVTFIGDGAAAYDLAILTARGLHVTGVSSFAVPLRRLVKWLDVKGGTDMLEAANQSEALFVLDFYQCYDKGECPLTGWQLQDVEVFLGERIDNDRAVFLHSAKALDKAGWWSSNLLKRVARRNRQIEVHG
jgi:hypothetical protein